MKRNLIYLLLTTLTVQQALSQTVIEKWNVTTIAGWEEDNKTMDGIGTKAHFTWEMGSCAIDAADNLYVIDQINLRKIDTDTKVTSLFGLGAMDEKYYDLKLKELPGNDGVCIDKEGNIYVASNKDHALYKIYPDKKVELFAGAEGYKGTDDGNRLEAEFTYPRRLCIDKTGNIYVTTALDDNRFHIHVRDTGIGIAADKINLIFDRFYQIDEEHFPMQEGSGIGLTLVKEYLHLLRGAVSVKSKTDEGTEFII